MKKVISLILLYIFSINQVFAGIFLYKIMPNTTDDKNLEYIEIYNSGTGKISLEGYNLKDKSGKTFDFGYGENIESNSSKKYYRSDTSIILNNTNEELYFYDKNTNLIDSFSYSTSSKSEAIMVHPNTTNTGSTQTGSTNQTSSGTTTNSGSTNSGSIENIDLIYEFQNPSYITDKTINLKKYICDDTKNECKLNLNLEKSFSGNIDNYNCEIDFGLKGWKTGEENKCNPSTITFPKGIFNIKMKIISKDNLSIYSEKSFILENNIKTQIIEKEKIVYKDKVCNSSSSSQKSNNSKSNSNNDLAPIISNLGTSTQITITKPIIQIQSGIKAGKCTKTDCNVNLIYESKNKNEQCLWDFGTGTFKTANTDKKCNPGYVHYNLGNHKIILKVFDKNNSNNFKISDLNFSNNIVDKNRTIIDINQEKINKIEKTIITEEISNTGSIIDNKLDIVDKKEINITGSGITEKTELISIENKKNITNSGSKIENKKNLKKKLVLPYFMDNYKIPKTKNQIIIQGRLGNKILSGSTIKCFDKCSINFVAKDNKDIKEYLWNFGNGKTFKGQNPSYVKYEKRGKYNVTLTTTLNNGIQNIENFEVNYQIKPKITKLKKKKNSKKKYKKSKKSKTKKKTGIYLSKEKLYSNYIPKKELNQNYVDKNEIGNYCSNIKYFPDTINKFKMLVLFLIGLVIVLGGFIVMKKRELI